MDELYSRLAVIYEIVSELLKRPEITGNSLEFRFRSALAELERTVKQAMPLLQQTEPDKQQLKQLLSIMYHAEEAADPLFLEWQRGAVWLGTVPTSTLKEIEEQMQQIEQQLEKAIPAVKDIFGKEQARYIIANIYRPEQLEMGGI